MNYNFIEIGTSDFDTCLEKAKDTDVGLSVEPLKLYLDQLPDKPNVTKVNCAISLDGTKSKAPIYWIHPDDIKKYNMTWWLRGCNSIGTPHFHHNKKETNNHMDLIRCDEIDLIPISELFSQYNVEKINLLKLDTEGGDCMILQSMLSLLENRDKEFWPQKIFFEANRLTAEDVILETVGLYSDIGYKMVGRTHQNIKLEL